METARKAPIADRNTSAPKQSCTSLHGKPDKKINTSSLVNHLVVSQTFASHHLHTVLSFSFPLYFQSAVAPPSLQQATATKSHTSQAPHKPHTSYIHHATMADTRPWITCHVLETVSGRPAPNMSVTLALVSSTTSTTSPTFTAKTNTDGRVTSWTPQSSTDLSSAIETAKKELKDDKEQLVWSLTFATGEFYGAGKTFWPEVELRFFTDVKEAHYHVPLLLGPWSYTTYRGS